MKLTKRGEWVLGMALLFLMWIFIAVSFTVGQNWKQDRMEQEGTIPPISYEVES